MNVHKGTLCPTEQAGLQNCLLSSGEASLVHRVNGISPRLTVQLIFKLYFFTFLPSVYCQFFRKQGIAHSSVYLHYLVHLQNDITESPTA